MARHKSLYKNSPRYTAVLEKTANSPDAEFEQSFFQLAFERLQEKLYNLLPFLVGFEVANKSSDGTKALGVFGFKSNNGQMLFVPAFFVNGDVKGVDLIYSKNNEQFYPLNEDFAELFLKDEATGLGDASKESEKQINQKMSPVELKDLVRPPRTGKVSYASVIDFVEESDNLTKQAFYTLFRDNDEFSESVLRFYPVEKIAKAVTPKVTKKKALPMSSVSVVTKKDKLNDLDEKQKGEVLEKGYTVIDKRKAEEKSKFGLVKYEEKFTNPTDSGFYAYLTQTGSLRYALIITKPMQLDNHFPTDEALVLDLDAKRDGQGYRAKVKNIFTKGKYDIKDLGDVMGMMQELSEVTPSFDEHYILVNDKLKATVPFRVTMNYKDDAGLRTIEVETTGSSIDDEFGPPRYALERSRNSYFKDKYPNSSSYYKKFKLVVTKKPGDKLEYANDSILVPKGFKLMSVRFRAPYYSECCAPVAESSDKERDERDKKAKEERTRYEQGKPGSLSNLFGALRSTSQYPLTVSNNGSEYFVTVGVAKKKFDNAISAKIAMITRLGMDEQSASELIDSVPPLGSKKGYIKLAYTGDQSFAPWDPVAYSNQLGQPEYDGVGHTETMHMSPSYEEDPTRLGLAEMPEVKGLDGAVNTANHLAQSAKKKFFDTHTIATLAKYVSPESKVTGYMPDFISCLDKLGRMLFLVHWETEKFEQMYGRSELPELVELLTNVFKNLGDLVIFLKRKSPELSINVSEKEMDA